MCLHIRNLRDVPCERSPPDLPPSPGTRARRYTKTTGKRVTSGSREPVVTRKSAKTCIRWLRLPCEGMVQKGGRSFDDLLGEAKLLSPFAKGKGVRRTSRERPGNGSLQSTYRGLRKRRRGVSSGRSRRQKTMRFLLLFLHLFLTFLIFY